MIALFRNTNELQYMYYMTVSHLQTKLLQLLGCHVTSSMTKSVIWFTVVTQLSANLH